MKPASNALSVWHLSGATMEYIVAAHGTAAAAKAFQRIAECRQKVPQLFPDSAANTSGATLATTHPGKVYRRSRRLAS